MLSGGPLQSENTNQIIWEFPDNGFGDRAGSATAEAAMFSAFCFEKIFVMGYCRLQQRRSVSIRHIVRIVHVIHMVLKDLEQILIGRTNDVLNNRPNASAVVYPDVHQIRFDL
jgi:hypothetical protein